MTAHIRTHHLLCTGDGTVALKWGATNAYTEAASGLGLAGEREGRRDVHAAAAGRLAGPIELVT